MQRLNPRDVALINVLGKPLPFKGHLETWRTDDYSKIKAIIAKAQHPVIVIDDAGYLMTNMFMRGHSGAGAGNAIFSFYNDIGDSFWGLIEAVRALNSDQRVYVMMHEDQNEFGSVKPKSIGKMVDEKVCLEGMFTICLRAAVSNGKHVFKTHSDGLDCAKTPIGMFESDEIDNDLALVDKTICEYYGIKEANANEKRG